MCVDDLNRLYERIRYNVKKIRKQKSISQLEVALAIGHTSSAFYAKAELGIENKKFNLEHLHKIAKVFDIEIGEFFKETPDEVLMMRADIDDTSS